jgi:hypothetical protein
LTSRFDCTVWSKTCTIIEHGLWVVFSGVRRLGGWSDGTQA